MEYGYIVLSNSKKGFIPSAIKWFTGSKFSHSFVIIPSVLDVPMGIEAASSGVDAVRFDKSYENDVNQGYEIWKLNVSKDLIDNSIKNLLNDLELSYGYLQYPWFIWRRINKFFGRDIKSQNNWNVDGMICSQLCVTHLNNCLLSETMNEYGKGSISPQDLKEIFIKYPNLFELIGLKE
jgi:hypothetical protein